MTEQRRADTAAISADGSGQITASSHPPSPRAPIPQALPAHDPTGVAESTSEMRDEKELEEARLPPPGMRPLTGSGGSSVAPPARGGLTPITTPPRPSGSIRPSFTPPPPATVGSIAPPASPLQSTRPGPIGQSEGTDPKARRARMAIRIPDDEISRPTSIAPVSYASGHPSPVTAQRIISIDPPEGFVWPDDEPTMRDSIEVEEAVADGHWVTSSDELIPIVTDPSEPPASAAAKMPDSEDVHFDEDDYEAPTLPPPPRPAANEPVQAAAAARTSEPGDEPEITPDDLVSVEAVPIARQMGTLSSPPGAQPPRPAKPASNPPAPRPPAASKPSEAEGLAQKRAAFIPPPPPAPIAKAATPARAPLVIIPPHAGESPAPQTEMAGSRRKIRPWWEDLFNDDFIRTMAKITDEQITSEVDFIEESLGVAKGGTMLDLGCGTGRHAIELSRRGYEVVGLDLSLPMLARAADEAQERGQRLNFVQGDMREMTFEEAFDGVMCWNTSFGYFEEEKNVQVIARVHKALKKTGQFILEVINRDFLVHQAPSLAWFEGDGCVCMDEMQLDWMTSRMRVKRTMMLDDGRSKEIEYSVRVYSLHELGKILHDSGFRVCEVSGRVGLPGVFFGSESPRTMILAEKR